MPNEQVSADAKRAFELLRNVPVMLMDVSTHWALSISLVIKMCILDPGIEIVDLASLAPHKDKFKTLTRWSSRHPSTNSDCVDVANNAH